MTKRRAVLVLALLALTLVAAGWQQVSYYLPNALTLKSLTIGSGPAMTEPPPLVWSSSQAGVLNSSIVNFASWTPQSNIRATYLDIQVQTAATCTVYPTVTVTDGTNTVTATLQATPSRSGNSGAVSVDFAAGTQLLVSYNYGTCSVAPAGLNVALSYVGR